MSMIVVSVGRCQFCHRTHEDGVAKIIAADSGLICDQCIRACTNLLGERRSEPGPHEYHERYAFQRVVRHFAPHRANEILSTSRTFPLRQQVDLQQALEAILGEAKVPANFVGIQSSRHEAIGYSSLLEQGRAPVEIAPPQYEEIDIGRGETVRCLKNGLWLLNDDGDPYVVVLAQPGPYSQDKTITVEIAVPPGERGAARCSRIFQALARRLSANSCYRGRVLSLEQDNPWSGSAQRIRVHDLPPIEHDGLILPAATLGAIERNVIGFAKQRPALRALGLSTQKGLLFHGAPGTGKTHCIRYLAGRLPDHTTLLITAEQVGLLPDYMTLARLLQPALVIIEDADLIARERSALNTCEEVLLNQLLNELDGLRERADVFFILTTNRPAMLEPALISRPGRIDQAIEFPLPDRSMRTRLIALYACGLAVPRDLIDTLAERTEGASPAFIKELMRRIAQHHLEAGNPASVASATADSALHEMLFSGGVLNRRMLGGESIVAEQA